MNLSKIFVFVFAFFAVLSCAQAKSLEDKYPSLYNNDWEKKVKLTAFQIEQVKQIRNQNQEKMNIFLMELDTIHHEMAALAEENDEQIRNILSDKQKVKFDMYRYQLKKQHNEHKGEDKPSRKKMRVY